MVHRCTIETFGFWTPTAATLGIFCAAVRATRYLGMPQQICAVHRACTVAGMPQKTLSDTKVAP